MNKYKPTQIQMLCDHKWRMRNIMGGQVRCLKCNKTLREWELMERES